MLYIGYLYLHTFYRVSIKNELLMPLFIDLNVQEPFKDTKIILQYFIYHF